MKFLNKSLRSLVRNLGYEIVNIENARLDAERLEIKKWQWLNLFGINTVIDIGANIGQFINWIPRILPNAKMYSFEPINECYQELVKGMDSYPNFRAYNLALSDQEGDVEFFLNDFTPSSSLLPMGALHRGLFPYTANTHVRKVKAKCLDSLIDEIYAPRNILLKMDVQGAEDKVIKGGQRFIAQSQAVLVEVSYYALYERQPLFEDVSELLRILGYKFVGNINQVLRPEDGVPIYADALFVKSELFRRIVGK